MEYKDYSWADWTVKQGYVVYMFDKRNYGFSTRAPAMDEPAQKNKPLSRSYLVIRDIDAVVDHIRHKHHVDKVSLIGWSWGAMTLGYYTSLHSEKVQKLVMYAPLYSFPEHTNLGAGSGLRAPIASARTRPIRTARFPSKTSPNIASPVLSRRSSTQRWPPILPALHGTRPPCALPTVLEDSIMQATGRRMFNASSIYVPTLVIGGDYDTWSFQEDREGLMRDLTNAPVKQNVLIKDATHFVIFEKHRFEFYKAVAEFLKE